VSNSLFRAAPLTKASGAYSSMAARYALAPLLWDDPGTVRGGSEESILQAMECLRDLYKCRLAELRRAGWPAIKDARDFMFAANCPPYSVVAANPRQRSCRRPGCPWCWSRRKVATPFHKLDYVLHGDVKRQTKLPNYDLYEVDTTFELRESEGRGLAFALDWVRTTKSTYYRNNFPDAVGGYVLCTIEPPKHDAVYEPWTLQHRVLAIVDSLTPCNPVEKAPVENSTRRVTQHCNPSRRDLPAIMGRVAQYPAGLMICNPEYAVELFNASGRIRQPGRTPGTFSYTSTRFAECYGAMRGQVPKNNSKSTRQRATTNGGNREDDEATREDLERACWEHWANGADN